MDRDTFTKEEFETYKKAARSLQETNSGWRLPAVTICRQAGARGELTAHALKQYLDATSKVELPWMVFEANLVDLILAQNLLPPSIVSNMPEDKVSLWRRLRSFISGKPTDRYLFCHTFSVISEILGLGQCIVVGRGASFCAASMPHVLKVKLLATRETAIRRIAHDEKISRDQANLIRLRRNRARDAYISTYYHKNPHKNEIYDLVIPTDNLRVVEVAEIIGKELLAKTAARGKA